MKAKNNNWLEKAKSSLKVGDEVVAEAYAISEKSSGKIEAIYEHYICVMLSNGFRQGFCWHDVATGKVMQMQKAERRRAR